MPPSAATTWPSRPPISIPVVVQDHPASSGVQMSADLLLALAAEAPSCRVIKLEEEPTPPKAGRLVEGSPDVVVLGGLGGAMLIEELRRGSHGTMTGFGFPEILVAIVRRWFAGDRDGRGGHLRPLRHARPVREPGDPEPGHPQARVSATGRDRARDAPRARACRPIRARSPTWTTCSAERGWTGTSRRGRGRTSIDVVEVSTTVDYRVVRRRSTLSGCPTRPLPRPFPLPPARTPPPTSRRCCSSAPSGAPSGCSCASPRPRSVPSGPPRRASRSPRCCSSPSRVAGRGERPAAGSATSWSPARRSPRSRSR